jgi:HlyD family secretion protein
MFRFSRRLVTGSIALLLLAGIFIWRLQGKQVTACPVKRQDLQQTVVTTGRVTSLAKVDVGSQLLASVTQVLVEAGDQVKAGQPLVRLNDEEARANLDQAEAAAREAELRLRQIGTVDGPLGEQRLREADATLRQKQSSYDRTQLLFNSGIVSLADLDEATRARDVAVSQLERERLLLGSTRAQGSEVKLAEARLSQARATVAVARERLSRTVITAPGSGVVIGRKVEAGDLAQPGVVLLTLSRPGRTQLIAQVDEKNLGLLQVGQQAAGSADAFPDRTFPARLSTIVPAVDPLRGTIEVRFDVESAPSYLVPDMTVSVEISVARRSKTMTIPTETVRDVSTTPWVLVIREGRAVRQAITTGIRGNGVTEVSHGLQVGEMVVPTTDLTVAGSRVRTRTTVSGKADAH